MFEIKQEKVSPCAMSPKRRMINGADVAMTFYTIVTSRKAVSVGPRSYMLIMGIRAARGEQLLTPYQWATQLEHEA